METTRGFNMTDRYAFDCGMCSYAKGWAQLDTKQDASYYGNWINPSERKTFSYCEGDTTLTICATDEEFVKHVREMIAWHNDAGYGPALIDATGSLMYLEFMRLGMGDLLH